MRIQSLIVLIPAVVGFLLLFGCLVFGPRNDFFRKHKRLMALLSCFFLFASLSSNTESRLMLHYTLFEQVCALALIPCLLSLLKEYDAVKSVGLFFKLCCMVPMLHLVVGIESVYVAGFEESVQIFLDSLSFSGPMFPYLDNNAQIVFYASYTYMFKMFMLVEFLLFAINMMSYGILKAFDIKGVLGFLFKKEISNPVPVIYTVSLILLVIIIPVLVLGKTCYYGNPVLTLLACLALAYCIFFIAMTCSAGVTDRISVNDFFSSIRKRK